MYNTSRGGGGGEGGGVDVKKWLADNKLSDVEKVFLEREIQIEELAEFQEAELTDFAKDLGLDTLQRRRFVKAIQDMRNARAPPPSYGESGGGFSTSTMTTTTGLRTGGGGGGFSTSGIGSTITGGGGGLSNYGEGSNTTFGSSMRSSSNIHVLMSPQEHKAMNKLSQVIDKAGYTLQQLVQSPNALKSSTVECDNDINEKFERIVAAIEDKRKSLLRDVERLKTEKEFKLKEQLGTLVQYQQMIAGGKQEYEMIMANSQLDITSRKKEVVRMVQGILNRKGINLVMATQPKMQLTFEPLMVEKFLKELEIDDCDQPHAPVATVIKATFNTVTITWQMTHPSLAVKVEEFSVEYAKVRKAEKKGKSSKKSKKKGKKKKKGSDDDSESGDSSESEEESDEDESDKDTKSGKKKRNKDDEKNNDKDALDDDLNENAGKDFTEEELMGLQWREAEVIKAQKGKYRLENGGWQFDVRGLKDSLVYAIRVRGRNKSGWGAYSVPVNGTTKKLTIDSVILKPKEKAALLKFVSKKERKKRWRLLFRASKDGFASTQFHAKCDNKGTTVTVVHTTTNHVFGGYTTLSWQSGGGSYQNDSNAFIFLLRSTNKLYKKPQKWTNKSSTNAVYHAASYGPTFGGGFDFYLCSGCDTTNGSYSNAGNSYNCPTDQTLLAGSYNFTVKDYEVYQIK